MDFSYDVNLTVLTKLCVQIVQEVRLPDGGEIRFHSSCTMFVPTPPLKGLTKQGNYVILLRECTPIPLWMVLTSRRMNIVEPLPDLAPPS